MKLEDVLQNSIGDLVQLSYIFYDEGILRDTQGILLEINADLITLRVRTRKHRAFKRFFRKWRDRPMYLNRHSCVLVDVTNLEAKE